MAGIERPRVERKEFEVWTLEHARQFAATAAADERFGPLWLVYLELGCRRGEGLGLRWIDVDQEKRAITIRQAVVRTRTEVKIKGTKGKRSRTLEVSDELLLALRRWRAVVNARRLRSRELWEDHGLVFADELGRPVDPGALRSHFRRLCRAAGVPVVRIHAMRHTAATLMVEAGAPLPAVSKRLGHARICTTTDSYGRTSPKMDDAAAAAIQSALYG
jgi:integrase